MFCKQTAEGVLPVFKIDFRDRKGSALDPAGNQSEMTLVVIGCTPRSHSLANCASLFFFLFLSPLPTPL